MPFIIIALFLAAAIGGGLSVAAQSALPGDALWGFKVVINENVEAALASAGKEQAIFDIAAIEARIQEAATLASQSTLPAEIKERVVSNVESHARNIVAEIAKLESSGEYTLAADVAARYQAVLSKTISAGLDVRLLLDEASRLFADLDQKTNQ